jgi:hypothetical protein
MEARRARGNERVNTMAQEVILGKAVTYRSIYFGDYHYDVNCKCGKQAAFEYQVDCYKKVICRECVEVAA